MTETPPPSARHAPEQATEKAQIGVGTLIVLIAVLIVAATTAGVLFNVTDILRSQAGESGETVGAAVESPIRVAGVTGRVNQSAAPAVLNRTRIVVALDGSGPVDLEDGTINLETTDSIETLVYRAEGPERGVSYGVEPIVDPDTSAPTLSDSADRFALVIETAGLSPGDRVTIRVSLESGASETIRFRVPDELDSKSAVTLR